MQKTGFISHISEESSIAEYIKSFLEEIFLGQLSLFVSSTDLRAGNWLSQIEDVLRQSSFVFPLLSQTSISRPWINFESGCAFIKKDVTLIPLCHGNLTPSKIPFPFASFQAYDLNDENSVAKLIRFLAEALDLNVPRINLVNFCSNVVSLSRVVDPFILDINDLRLIQEFQGYRWINENPEPIDIEAIEIWDELELRARTSSDSKVLEISGFSKDSMGLNVKGVLVPEGANYLLLEVKNSTNSESKDFDKLLKVIFDRQVVTSVIRDHRHPIDVDYVFKADGFFVYEIPPINRYNKSVNSLQLCFWKIALQGLIIKFYFI